MSVHDEGAASCGVTPSHSFIRSEVYNQSNGPIDIDYMRLVYNADTYNRY